jgi:hypothetical protein
MSYSNDQLQTISSICSDDKPGVQIRFHTRESRDPVKGCKWCLAVVARGGGQTRELTILKRREANRETLVVAPF